MIKTILNTIKSFFVDGTGQLSMMRLVCFLLFAIATFILFYSLFANQIQTNQEIIKWLYGISIAGKAIQSIPENFGGGTNA